MSIATLSFEKGLSLAVLLRISDIGLNFTYIEHLVYSIFMVNASSNLVHAIITTDRILFSYFLGHYGQVFKAEYNKETGTGRTITVAVKTLKKYQSQKAHDDFLKEMSITAQFAHPNVIKLFGLVQQGSCNYSIAWY